MRGNVPVFVAGSNPRRIRFYEMKETTLSLFVDESGRFLHPDKDSRFYILGMVFHDQSSDISQQINDFDKAISELGLDAEAFVFHAGPLIRKEKGYEYFTRLMRGKIYRRMMTFARKLDFKYHSLCVDKKYIGSSLQIVTKLGKQLDEFISSHRDYLSSLGRLKVYYDCGQSPVTNLLRKSFSNVGCEVKFAQGVRPVNYKLFQVADLICTLTLEAKKFESAERPTDSEFKFFGGARAFKKEELKFLKSKWLS